MRDNLWTSNPTTPGMDCDWYVWNAALPMPPKPVFFGTMEDCGFVADALRKREQAKKEGQG